MSSKSTSRDIPVQASPPVVANETGKKKRRRIPRRGGVRGESNLEMKRRQAILAREQAGINVPTEPGITADKPPPARNPIPRGGPSSTGNGPRFPNSSFINRLFATKENRLLLSLAFGSIPILALVGVQYNNRYLEQGHLTPRMETGQPGIEVVPIQK